MNIEPYATKEANIFQLTFVWRQDHTQSLTRIKNVKSVMIGNSSLKIRMLSNDRTRTDMITATILDKLTRANSHN